MQLARLEAVQPAQGLQLGEKVTFYICMPLFSALPSMLDYRAEQKRQALDSHSGSHGCAQVRELPSSFDQVDEAGEELAVKGELFYRLELRVHEHVRKSVAQFILDSKTAFVCTCAVEREEQRDECILVDS